MLSPAVTGVLFCVADRARPNGGISNNGHIIKQVGTSLPKTLGGGLHGVVHNIFLVKLSYIVC
jgi:hypothetical protein